MSMLSVRIPEDVDTQLPRKDRSRWVIDAIRQKLRRERIRTIAGAASRHAKRDASALAEWEGTSAPLPDDLRRLERVLR